MSWMLWPKMLKTFAKASTASAHPCLMFQSQPSQGICHITITYPSLCVEFSGPSWACITDASWTTYMISWTLIPDPAGQHPASTRTGGTCQTRYRGHWGCFPWWSDRHVLQTGCHPHPIEYSTYRELFVQSRQPTSASYPFTSWKAPACRTSSQPPALRPNSADASCSCRTHLTSSRSKHPISTTVTTSPWCSTSPWHPLT